MLKKLIPLLFPLIPFVGIAQNKIDLLLLKQEYSNAIEQIDKQLNTTKTGELYFKKSLAHQKLMDYPAAVGDLNQALNLDSENVKYLTSRADLMQAMGNYGNAVVDFQHALQLHPENLLLKYECGKSLLYLNDYRKADQMFKEIQTVDSTNVMYNKYSALAAFKADSLKRAVKLYCNYLHQNPSDLSAYFNLSKAYEKLKDKDKMMMTLFRAGNQFPNNSSVHLKTANASFENKDFQMAQRLYYQYMSKYDTLIPVLLNYGICLYHNKYTEDAIEILEKVYSVAPNDVYVNFYLGVSHKRLDHYKLAANYLDFAIYISIPEFHPEMYHHLAQVYGSQREFEKSIECYKKAYELDSRKVEVLFEIATTYEEFNFNKTLALNYYQQYLQEAGEEAKSADYALGRLKRIKEELFFEE
ncbi:tetratricopeptide repeat protein [uncultured Sunxiuqinia sp.]|uniref:tetratricopeptide repeat protein n=1 Tax=uncultured Sunxiuqinia sp. TaxID=1573825 RepID=UPI002AA67B05|nr:tetratricopeptide repeat protein [uncultured Sunxiuqinia sp.]